MSTMSKISTAAAQYGNFAMPAGAGMMALREAARPAVAEGAVAAARGAKAHNMVGLAIGLGAVANGVNNVGRMITGRDEFKASVMVGSVAQTIGGAMFLPRTTNPELTAGAATFVVAGSAMNAVGRYLPFAQHRYANAFAQGAIVGTAGTVLRQLVVEDVRVAFNPRTLAIAGALGATAFGLFAAIGEAGKEDSKAAK